MSTDIASLSMIVDFRDIIIQLGTLTSYFLKQGPSGLCFICVKASLLVNFDVAMDVAQAMQKQQQFLLAYKYTHKTGTRTLKSALDH